jgi:hypothetical protein
MNDLLLNAISESYRIYLTHGARSSAKLAALHGFFHDMVEQNVARKLPGRQVRVYSDRNRELTVEGSLYPKRVDVAVEVDGEVAGAISLKFVVTNYKQNANNYFEHLLGETANIRSADIAYASFSVIPLQPEYLSKAAGNARGEVVRKEKITRENLMKYVNLSRITSDPAFRPSPLGLLIVDLDKRGVTQADLSGLGLSAEELRTMRDLADVGRFFSEFSSNISEVISG